MQVMEFGLFGNYKMSSRCVFLHFTAPFNFKLFDVVKMAESRVWSFFLNRSISCKPKELEGWFLRFMIKDTFRKDI